MAQAPSPPARVLLISAPFASLHYPNIGLSLLKAGLARAGIGCDIRYISLDYAERIGPETHDRLTDTRSYRSLVGEWVFAHLANDGSVDDLAYLSEAFQKRHPELFTITQVLEILKARQDAGAFVEDCIAAVDWNAYAVIGFTTSFQQTMASLALARRIKQRHPHLVIVFGGANCEAAMGIELHRRYPFIDAVCSGEGDRAFPAFVERHLAGRGPDGLAAIIWRRDGESVVPERLADPVEDMDWLPYPDFDDFFAQHARCSRVAKTHKPTALFETARGCWWGAKHHCTFCGLNGQTMPFRSKPQDRAHDEVMHLAARHGRDLVNVDTILDMAYFERFLPRLAAADPPLTIYYETKANLKPQQLLALSRAGVKKVQPGIEALDSEILRLMRKGCTMLQNVQTLKLGAENGLYIEWNLLYGFPGEGPEHYRNTLAVMRKIAHLQPPGGVARVRADRFSPYFERPREFGVTIAPAEVYRYIFPFDDASIGRLAYHFDMESSALTAMAPHVATLTAACETWHQNLGAAALYCDESGDLVTVTDHRPGWLAATHRLDPAESDVHRLCWRITARHRIERSLTDRHAPDRIAAAIDRLLGLGLLLDEDDRYLALALRQPGFRSAPSWAQIRAGEPAPYTIAEDALKPGRWPEWPLPLSGDQVIGREKTLAGE